jgi:hypothetical protein
MKVCDIIDLNDRLMICKGINSGADFMLRYKINSSH